VKGIAILPSGDWKWY